jgi:predicted phosphodiesterase
MISFGELHLYRIGFSFQFLRRTHVEYEVVEVGTTFIYVLHDLKEIDLNPAAASFRVVVSGHSHKPLAEERKGVLYLNPGSAGPRRFTLPVTVARLRIRGGSPDAEIVKLDV